MEEGVVGGSEVFPGATGEVARGGGGNSGAGKASRHYEFFSPRGVPAMCYA